MELKDDGSGAATLVAEAGGCLDCIAAKTVPEKSAGLSSEQSSLTAALMLPSSTLDVTARERSKVFLPYHYYCLLHF